MQILMQERDYFRKEAIKLDTICKDQEKKLKDSRALNKVFNEDKAYYESFILGYWSILNYLIYFFKISRKKTSF